MAVNIMDAVAVDNTSWTGITLPNNILGGIDVQMSTGNSFKLSFSSEQTDTVNGSLDTALSLTYSDITDVVVTNSDGSVTYVESTDYEVDLANGTITLLSTGSMSADTDYLVEYLHYPYFRGIPGLSMNQNLSREVVYIKAEEASADTLILYYSEKR